MLEYESDIIERAKTNASAFGELYDDSYDKIYYYLLRRCGNQELAQDLTSETFFKALKALHSYHVQPGKPFIAWLYRIASNEMNKYFRQQNKYRFVESEEHDVLAAVPSNQPDAFMQIVDQQSYEAVHGSLTKLHPKDQTLLSLRHFEEKSMHEIADILEISEGTVKSRLHRAHHKLRKIMERQGNSAII